MTEGERSPGAVGSAVSAAAPSGGHESVSVKLEEVVGGGDEPPFGPDRASASSVEARHPAVVFGLAEDGLDHRLAAAVELAAALAGQDAAHEGVVAAGPARPWRLAFAGVGWDEHLSAGGVRAFHLALMPVAGVGEDDAGRLVDAGVLHLAAGGVEHRLEVAEVAAGGHDLGGEDDLVLVGDGLGVVALDETAQGLDDDGGQLR